MHDCHNITQQWEQPVRGSLLRDRRDFLATTSSGLGALALGSLLHADRLLADPADSSGSRAPRMPHFAPRAKHCIFVFLAGAPSQIDLLDPKPKLVELHGQPLPESLGANGSCGELANALRSCPSP